MDEGELTNSPLSPSSAGAGGWSQCGEGRLLIPQLGVSLGLWQGSYENIDRLWLRWFTVEGELITIPSEEATVAEQRATAAEQRATAAEQTASLAQHEAAEARQRAEKLAAKLRELNIDPDELE